MVSLDIPVRICREIHRSSGITGLWTPGLSATVCREILYSGCTKGIYPLARSAISGGKHASDITLTERALAAACTGIGGSICANPIDLVKVRLFAEPTRYPGVTAALRTIAREEGVLRGQLCRWGHWNSELKDRINLFFQWETPVALRGLSASAPRGGAIAIGEITTYDHTKSMLRELDAFRADVGESEPFRLHIVTSLITGIVATTVAAPFDCIKSRVMADTEGRYRGGPSAVSRIVGEEGVAALFRGWWPAYSRLGPHAILCFPLYEWMRVRLGLENL